MPRSAASFTSLAPCRERRAASASVRRSFSIGRSSSIGDASAMVAEAERPFDSPSSLELNQQHTLEIWPV